MWPDHIISLNPIDRTKTNCPAARYLLSRSLSLQNTLLWPFLSTLSWVANECRWCSGGCSGLITGVTCALWKPSALQSGYGERFSFSGKVPTSINREAKEVCLLGPPWLDLAAQGKARVSAQPREHRARLVVLVPFLLINHRNKCKNHTSRQIQKP